MKPYISKFEEDYSEIDKLIESYKLQEFYSTNEMSRNMINIVNHLIGTYKMLDKSDICEKGRKKKGLLKALKQSLQLALNVKNELEIMVK